MMNNAVSRLSCCCAVATLALCAGLPAPADTDADTQAIKDLIATYAMAVDRADTQLVDQLFSAGPEVTFIYPLGEEHGRDQIEADVFRKLMGEAFSERKLTPKEIAIHVYGDTAWSEFNWDFVAKTRSSGSPVHSQGRETQIYHRENGQWRIVHVHYSGAPVSGNSKAF